MLSPASILEVIEPDKNYIGLSDGEHPIFSLHCTKTNECDVIVHTIGNSVVKFPPGSFVAGATYHIYIKQMSFDPMLAGFIGYRQLNTK